MFSRWIVNGVGVGIEVFFGAFTFALCCCVVLAVAGMIGGFIRAGRGDGDDE